MPLMDALGYEHRPPNGFHRSMQHVGSSRGGAWLLSRISPTLDRWAFRLSDGRWTFISAMSALPVVLVTTTGARSGIPRPTPLIGIPFERDLAVVGSGYGRPQTPGWVHNLRADPRAEVTYRETTVAVEAVEPRDPTPIWSTAESLYPGYGKYPTRVDRKISVFVLQPS